ADEEGEGAAENERERRRHEEQHAHALVVRREQPAAEAAIAPPKAARPVLTRCHRAPPPARFEEAARAARPRRGWEARGAPRRAEAAPAARRAGRPATECTPPTPPLRR